MQLFSGDPKILSEKFWINFLSTKTLKNGPQKLLIISQNLFFSQSSPAQSTAHSPKLIFHIINMSQDSSVSLSEVWIVFGQLPNTFLTRSTHSLTKYSTSYIQQIAIKMKLCLILIGLLAFSVCSIQAQEGMYINCFCLFSSID